MLKLFAYGISLSQDDLVNPTFFKLVGKEDGSEASQYPYYAGATVALTPDSKITITDNSKNGNVQLNGEIDISSRHGNRSESAQKVFRTSGSGTKVKIQIL